MKIARERLSAEQIETKLRQILVHQDRIKSQWSKMSREIAIAI
jgi:hypothetical protein